jgi:hypothetical protein
VALGQSITRHPCWLPVIACPARPLEVEGRGNSHGPSRFCACCALSHRRYCLPQRSSSVRACVTRSKSGCSGAMAETETHGTAA